MDELRKRVWEASRYKFGAQGKAFFPLNHIEVGSMDNLWDLTPGMADGMFCMVIDRVAHRSRIHLNGFRLVECIVFEGEWFYLTAIRDRGVGVKTIDLVPKVPPAPLTGLSLGLICTDVPMYKDFLKRAVGYYRGVLEGLEHEICVAMFGTTNLTHVHLCTFPVRNFGMAYARNRVLEMCSMSHVMVVDLDCYLTRQQVMDLIAALPHTHGVINFCRPTFPFKGNGLWLGERTKVLANRYNEAFRGFFFEDTEFLMNLSRIGIVPWCMFVDFENTDHPRDATRGWYPRNKELFGTILKQGHR